MGLLFDLSGEYAKDKPRYNVVKIMRKSRKRVILRRNLIESDAQRVVKQYPDSSRSMVIYEKSKSKR